MKFEQEKPRLSVLVLLEYFLLAGTRLTRFTGSGGAPFSPWMTWSVRRFSCYRNLVSYLLSVDYMVSQTLQLLEELGKLPSLSGLQSQPDASAATGTW